MNENALDKILNANLARVIDFVRFAETKNAALLTFCSAWIVAIVNLLLSSNQLPLGYRTIFLFCLPLFVIAAVTCLASFLPRVRLDRFHKRDDEARNLLFFGDIATVPLGELRTAFAKRYEFGADAPADAYLDDIAIQIGVNARIASRKFRMFNVAAGCVLISVAVMTIPPFMLMARWACSALR